MATWLKAVQLTNIEDIELVMKMVSFEQNSTALAEQITLLNNSLACYNGELP